MPKFKNLSPWALPDPIPNGPLEIAKLAIQRMGSIDPATEMEVFQTDELKDAVDNTWIVSGQSGTQRELLAKLADKQTVYVEGAFTIWLRKTSINYFILRSDPVLLSPEQLDVRAAYDFDGIFNTDTIFQPNFLNSWYLQKVIFFYSRCEQTALVDLR